MDYTGYKFGMLTVLRRADDRIMPSGKHEIMYECVCNCGNVKTVRISSLKNGNTKSCGCYRAKSSSDRRTKHGASQEKIYRVWRTMKDRCESPTNKSYYLYGGRGIKVCEEWHDSAVFIAWAKENGYVEGTTLDRIDSNKDYCPENCRWVDRTTQNNNTSRNHMITFNGKTQTMAEWSRETGISYHAIKSRLNKYHWSVEDALTKPVT